MRTEWSFNTLTFHINHSCCFLAAIEVLYFTCVTPSIFYLGVCYGQCVLYFFIHNCSIKFPQVSRFWQSISLAPQCYVLVNSHDCWVWSQNHLLRSIWKETTIFTQSTNKEWCLALHNILEYSKNNFAEIHCMKLKRLSWNNLETSMASPRFLPDCCYHHLR